MVTLDLRMPGMDGLAVLRAIKTYDSQIEVLIITGYGTIKNAIELVRLGACVYLTKPFHISEVTHEIILAIEKRGRIDRLNRQFIG
ncbi:MAG: response regulator (plasmid) [Candidatus Manganitrophus sp.]|nr:MAG: response regulator [Candidatus Manganitrophus sp.]